MKPNQCNYYNAKIKSVGTQLEFEELAEMCRFIEQNQISNVFVINGTNAESNYFAIYKDACLFTHKTLGFNTLENYATAHEKGFPNASTFYEAQQQGYTKYSDYVLVKEAGIADIATFEIIRKKGFITGFNIFKEMSEQEPKVFSIDVAINNPYELFCYANKHHFEDFGKLLEAFSKGFTDADLYNSASEMGFPNYNDFVEASNKQFRNYKDLELARERKIRDADDFQRHNDLEILRKNGESHDQLLLLIVLSKVEQGKRVSLNKLTTGLENAVKEYCYSDTNEMPLWFTIGLKNSNDVAEFLQKNIAVKKYGNYDVDGEFFEINQMRDRAVVLDASNVAHNSNVNTDKKVLAGNILIMVNFLKQKGFEDITVIADASLRHKIADAEIYDKLQKETTLLVAPKETSADMYIINYVKKHHCLVVSNDTFREWKILDPWVADNIDFYRLSFLIKGNEVLMPDLK